MFQSVKQKVSLLELIEKDTGLLLKESGQNWVIDSEDEQGGCPFCGHHDCFRIKEESVETAFFHCFSCGEHGDIFEWRAKRKKINLREACVELAQEYEIPLPHNYSPIQEIFEVAAKYYENNFWVECNRPYPELGKLTPLDYQLQVRHHSEDILKRVHIGWGDGGLSDFLTGVGFEEDLLVQSGMVTRKDNKPIRDFLPSRCFIFPHYVRGRVSHFTFKDPLKKLAYQLPKKFTLNGWTFYNQDSVRNAQTVIVCEGEHDLISILDTGKANAVIATIGQLSSTQLAWMRDNLGQKNIATCFDPDGAGDEYRIKVEKNRASFKNLAHVLPPDGKDIDELLGGGADLADLIKNNLVEVKLDEDSKPGEVEEELGLPWSGKEEKEEAKPEPEPTKPDQEAFISALKEIEEGEAKSNEEEEEEEGGDESGEGSSYDNIEQRKGSYFKITYKEGVPTYSQISDFIIKLLNIYETVEGERHREVQIVKDNGYKSKPIMVNSDTKVSLRLFRSLVAKAADASFMGTERDLDNVWKMVFAQTNAAEIKLIRSVGRQENLRSWVFRNKLIMDTGAVIDADDSGVFWLPGKRSGVRPDSLADVDRADSKSDIPSLITDLTDGERDELVTSFLDNLSTNLNNRGDALLLLGWTYASVYSDLIFELNRGFPFMFLWGINGKGKSTIAKWVTQDFWGITGYGSTSVPNLKSGAGLFRLADYYSCLPLIVDEVRSDELTKQYLGMFRSFYDREARVMGTEKFFGVKSQKPKSNFVFIGEDQFEDAATRERCIPIRIPVKGRELSSSYLWMEDNKSKFTGVTYKWILESCDVLLSPDSKTALKEEIKGLDRALLEAGCSQRTSKNWAAIGVFSEKLCQKYCPDFDFIEYLKKVCLVEAEFQTSNTTLTQFWEYVEGIKAQERSPINNCHILTEGNLMHIWYPPVFRAVQDTLRGHFPFSKNAVKSAIREEPYFVSENRKVSMGLEGTRRTVITLDLNHCPDSVRNIAEVN